jgi:hypothetical protein
MPQITESSPFEKASDLETDPDFIQQVPPFQLDHVKWVQPEVAAHLPPQSSPLI